MRHQRSIWSTCSCLKVHTCQFHFKNDARANVSEVGDVYRKEFLNICKDMCRVVTVALYNFYTSRLEDIDMLFQTLSGWIQ